MVANVRGYTPNYGFKLINFDTPRWHTLEYANWSQLDAMFLQFGASGIRGEWVNSTEYLIGERVFDGTNGLIYRCLVQHTSAATGTFAEDRTLHPTFWSLQLGGVPVFRGDWTTGVTYGIGDIVVVNEYEYFLCTSPNIAGATFPGNGPEWQTIFDATEVVTDAIDAKNAAAGYANAAQSSASNAAVAEDGAEDAAEEAEAWAEDARAAQGAFRWAFNTDTTAVDPTSGRVAFNNANPALVTEVYISAESAEAGNPDVSPWIVTWDDSTNTLTRGTLQMRKVGASEQFIIFELTGNIVDNNTWLKLNVMYISHSGALLNGDPLNVGFVRAGNAGPVGSGGGDMLRAANLSDVVSIPTSRNNLGLGTAQIPTFSEVLLTSPVTDAKHAATKEYVDASPSLYIGDAPPSPVQDGSLWWDSDRGMLLVYYFDGDTRQWVDAVAIPGIDTATFVKKTGDIMTGHLGLPAGPAATQAVRKDYVDTPADGKFYARQGALWVEVPRYQRFPLVGVQTLDVQVPAGAKQARLTGMLWNGGATQPSIVLSVTPGVFRTVAGDYSYFGFAQDTASVNAITTANGISASFMPIGGAITNTGQVCQFEALLTIVRPTASQFFNLESKASYYTGGSHVHTFYNTFMQAVGAGSVLGLLAFRFTGGIAWGGESYLNVEWL
jgi:hypothetical protein